MSTAVGIRVIMAFRQTDIDKAREEGVKGNVEYRSPLAGEDMPRKPLDSLEGRSHCGQWVGLACSTPPTASRRVRGLGQSPRRLKSASPQPNSRGSTQPLTAGARNAPSGHPREDKHPKAMAPDPQVERPGATVSDPKLNARGLVAPGPPKGPKPPKGLRPNWPPTHHHHACQTRQQQCNHPGLRYRGHIARAHSQGGKAR